MNFSSPSIQHWHWPQIERHPRLVFEDLGSEEADMVRYYISRQQAFTVVMGAPTVSSGKGLSKEPEPLASGKDSCSTSIELSSLPARISLQGRWN